MRTSSIAIFLTLAFAGTTVGQNFLDAINTTRQIKLLQSTRGDVKKILAQYEAGDDDDHNQVFSNEVVNIEVTYASGSCAEDSNEDDASEIWNVKEWIVTKIKIEPERPVSVLDSGLSLTSFKKERRFPNDIQSFVFYDKASGTAVKTDEDGIESFILFPPRAQSEKLCSSTAAKGFYKRKGWFSQDRPFDYACILINQPANVQDMTLSLAEIDDTSSRLISVTTTAIDSENDVLHFDYKVSAGVIVGRGSQVKWDLTGVAPGTYTITAGVDDGAGIVGKTVTKTLTVK